MTTKHSPLSALKAQADKIAEMLKRAERGEKIDKRFAERIDAARSKDVFKIGIVMDDKVITIGMPWAAMVERMRGQMAEGGRRVSLDLIKEDDAARDREERTNRQYQGGTVDNLHDLVAAGRKFSAILADPPWHFATHSDKGDGRSASKHYKTDENSLAAMKALPVEQLAADDCVLFIWMLDWCPRWALDLIEAWGFTHKTTAFTWAKQTRDETGFHMGQGYWTRANPESCWLATRGHPKRLHADVRQLVVAPVMEHSRKPEIIHTHIERLVDGPYLELYARRPRDKWQTWGNELLFKIASADLPPHDPETGELIEETPAGPMVADGPTGEHGLSTGDRAGMANAAATAQVPRESTAEADGSDPTCLGGQRACEPRVGSNAHEPCDAPNGKLAQTPAGRRDDPKIRPTGGDERTVSSDSPEGNNGSAATKVRPPDDNDDLDIPNFLKATNPDSMYARSQREPTR